MLVAKDHANFSDCFPLAPMNLLFNASPRSTYQAGAYDGLYSYAHLLKQGDFGLGATNKNDALPFAE
jgi:hypothetical protein